MKILRLESDSKAVQRSALSRSRRELSNAYFLAKFRLDTAENEPCQVCPIEPGIRLHGLPHQPRRAGLRDLPSLEVPREIARSTRSVHVGLKLLCRIHRRGNHHVGFRRRHDGRSAKFRQNVARFRLYRRRSLQVNTRFAAFCKIYQII